jgi:hypothetical protein
MNMRPLYRTVHGELRKQIFNPPIAPANAAHQPPRKRAVTPYFRPVFPPYFRISPRDA